MRHTLRQTQSCQYEPPARGVGPELHALQRTVRGSILDTQLAQAPVACLHVDQEIGAPTERGQPQGGLLGGQWQAAFHSPLCVENLLARVSIAAVDLERGARSVLAQRNMHFSGFVNDQRSQPNDIAKPTARGRLIQAHAGFHGRTTHFKMAHARQDVPPPYAVVLQKELLRTQHGGVAHFRERGAIDVQQRMHRRTRDRSGDGRACFLCFDSMHLAQKRIARQAQSAGLPPEVESRPVDLYSLQPQLQRFLRVTADGNVVCQQVQLPRREPGIAAQLRAVHLQVTFGHVGDPRAQRLGELRDRAHKEPEAILHRIPAHLKRVCQTLEVAVLQSFATGRTWQRRQQLRRVRAQPLVAARRQYDCGGAARRERRGNLSIRLATMIFQNEMRVRAAETEGAHRGQPPAPRIHRPLLERRVDVHRALSEVDVLIGALAMDARRQLAVLQAQACLDDTHHARSGGRVSNVSLHGTERAELLLLGEVSERIRQRMHFDGVTQPGRGAMSLDVLNLLNIDAASAVDRLLQPTLRQEAGHGDARSLAILVCPARHDHRVDVIVVPFSIGEALEHQHSDGIADDDAVGAIVERPALAGRREHPRVVHRYKGHRVVVHIRAAGERDVDFPSSELLTGQIDGDQGRGASRVQRDGGTFQIEEVRQPCRQDAVLVAEGREMRRVVIRRRGLQRPHDDGDVPAVE